MLPFGRRLKHAARYRHILAVLVKYGLAEAVSAVRRRRWLRRGRRPGRVEEVPAEEATPARVRMALEELGPTFIKLGQLASTRPDLIPARYIVELEKLQDDVPPAPFAKIRAQIESDLGMPLNKAFRRFDPHPLAAGSVAQVHRATTKDGRQIAVKVRRPDIVEIVRIDGEILRANSQWVLGLVLPFLEPDDRQRMIDEFTDAVMKEVDLGNERENIVRFADSYADDPHIHVPRVHPELCTDGVLAMEYIEGIKPSNLRALDEAGLDRPTIARRGADFVLQQIFDNGFFHTDPHPGNFFVLPENVLAPIDFGQTARLTSGDRNLLMDMVLALVDRDAKRIVHALHRREIVGEDTDLDALEADAEGMLDKYANRSLGDMPFGQVLAEGFELIRTHRVRPPAQFSLMLKSLMTVESLAMELDPDFVIIDYLKPYARRLQWRRMDPKRFLRSARRAMQDAGDLAARLPTDVHAIVNKVRKGQFQLRIHHEHLEDLEETLDKSSNRISFALIMAALLVGSSLLVTRDGKIFGLVTFQTFGGAGYLVAALLGVWLVISILRSRHF
jgi:ubiquinone biosynthesis protein